MFVSPIPSAELRCLGRQLSVWTKYRILESLSSDDPLLGIRSICLANLSIAVMGGLLVVVILIGPEVADTLFRRGDGEGLIVILNTLFGDESDDERYGLGVSTVLCHPSYTLSHPVSESKTVNRIAKPILIPIFCFDTVIALSMTEYW